MPDTIVAASGVADAWSVTAIVVLIGSTVVGIPIWISKQLRHQRDEMFKLLSKNKTECRDVKERVGILEVKQEADSKKIDKIDEEVTEISSQLSIMKITQAENHSAILSAIMQSK